MHRLYFALGSEAHSTLIQSIVLLLVYDTASSFYINLFTTCYVPTMLRSLAPGLALFLKNISSAMFVNVV